jgi:hypothetical protein
MFLIMNYFRPTFALFAVCLIPISFSLCVAADSGRVVESGPAEKLVLPPPYATRSVANPSRVIGWPKGKMPTAPAGFEVNLFAEDLDNPRTIHVLPNGDVLVMESQRRQGPSRIILFRDDNQDGKPERREVFIDNLNGAFGMALHGNRFYVGNTDGVVVFPYQSGDTRITRRGEKILDLPGGGHYTRNVVVDPDAKKLYISVGSATNVDEEMLDAKDSRRAAILQANLDGSAMRVFASGLRNAVGLDWEPKSKQLWAAVNERDMLGDELVPDYLTSVKETLSMAGRTLTSARTKIRVKKTNVPTSSPKRSNPTTRSAPTSRRWDWHFTPASHLRRAITAAHSSACTVPGTDRIWSATKSPSCRFKTANRAAPWKIS